MFNSVKAKISKSYFNKGMRFFERENYKDAILFFNTAEKYFSPEAMQQLYFDTLHRGIAYCKLKEYQKAEFDILNYIEFVENDQQSYLWLGTIYERKKEYQKAFHFLEKLIQLNPSDTQAWNKLGLIKSNLGQYKEALADLNKALQLNPEHPDTHGHLGFTYYKMNDLEKAHSHTDQALEIDSNNSLYFKNKALILIEENKYRAALGILYKAEDSDIDGNHVNEIKELIREVRLELREDN